MRIINHKKSKLLVVIKYLINIEHYVLTTSGIQLYCCYQFSETDFWELNLIYSVF